MTFTDIPPSPCHDSPDGQGGIKTGATQPQWTGCLRFYHHQTFWWHNLGLHSGDLMEHTMADPQRDQADRPTEHFSPQMRLHGAKCLNGNGEIPDQPILLSRDRFSAERCGWDLDLQPTPSFKWHLAACWIFQSHNTHPSDALEINGQVDLWFYQCFCGTGNWCGQRESAGTDNVVMSQRFANGLIR